MKSIGLAALGLSLVSATAAYAQTTVTREVSDMPVETTIIHSPTGTTVTRRVLPTAESETVAVPAPPVRGVTTTVRSSRVAERPRASTRVVTRSRSAPPVYAMATAGPVVLNAAERDVVYREIVDRRALPVEQRGILAPIGSMFPTIEPARPTATYVQPAPVRTTYVVGSRLPADIQLVELPETVIEHVPAIAPYAYAMVDGRVLLVDPQTGTIVSDLTTY